MQGALTLSHTPGRVACTPLAELATTSGTKGAGNTRINQGASPVCIIFNVPNRTVLPVSLSFRSSSLRIIRRPPSA